MGLLEKLKNTFFEEEYIEVEEEKKPKKETKPIAKKIEPIKEEKKIEPIKPEIEVEPIVEEEKNEVFESYADKELLKNDHAIQYFEDDDFVEPSNQPLKAAEPIKLYGQEPEKIYDHLEYTEEHYRPYTNPTAKTGFKPTPIISPIYGILDKNYKKEELIDKKDKPSSYVSRKNADLDFIRNKAFGRMDDFVSAQTYVEPETEEIESAENLLYDMTESDGTPSVEKVTIADAEEYFEDLGLEYNIDYKDSKYEKATGRRTKSEKEEAVEKNSAILETTESDDLPAEDNLFDLIDSMYEDKE